MSLTFRRARSTRHCTDSSATAWSRARQSPSAVAPAGCTGCRTAAEPRSPSVVVTGHGSLVRGQHNPRACPRMSDIDDYLAAVSDRLHVPRARRQRILDEVRDHLADATTSLEARGIPAPRICLPVRPSRLSARPEQLAREFNAQAATATMRRTPVVIGASGIAVASGFALAAATLPASLHGSAGRHQRPDPVLRSDRRPSVRWGRRDLSRRRSSPHGGGPRALRPRIATSCATLPRSVPQGSPSLRQRGWLRCRSGRAADRSSPPKPAPSSVSCSLWSVRLAQ